MGNRNSSDNRSLKYGDIVRSKCGRDRKRPFMVIGTGSRNGYCIAVLADGELRPVSRPKAKNVLHVEKIGEATPEELNRFNGMLDPAGHDAELEKVLERFDRLRQNLQLDKQSNVEL